MMIMAEALGARLTDDGFRVIAESIPHIVWLKRPDGSADYLNRRGADFFGVAPETTYGWSFLDLVHPDDVAAARDAWRHIVRQGADYAIDVRMRRADGEYRWMASRACAIRGAGGAVVKWIGTLTDVDDQIRSQQALRRAQDETAEALTLLDTLQSTAPVGFLFVDREFRYVRVNDTA